MSLLGGPKRAVLVREVKPQNSVPGLFGKDNVGVSLIPIAPMGGGQNIAAGASFNFELKANYNVVRFILDLPEAVHADLMVDGSALVSVDDDNGLVGTLDVGDFTGRAYFPVKTVALVGTNGGATAQDVRAWLVVVAGSL